MSAHAVILATVGAAVLLVAAVILGNATEPVAALAGVALGAGALVTLATAARLMAER